MPCDPIEFPPGPTGYMINFTTWERYIRASDGSELMKDLVVNYVKLVMLMDRVNSDVLRDSDLLDSFKLGYAYGEISNGLTKDGISDFYRTIQLTRNLDNVPLVRIHGQPVS